MKNVWQTICEVIPEGLESGKQTESGVEQVFWAHTLVQNEDQIHSAPTMEWVSFLCWLCACAGMILSRSGAAGALPNAHLR